MPKLDCRNVAQIARGCLDKKKSIGETSTPIGNSFSAHFNCQNEDSHVVVSVRSVSENWQEENERILELTRRIDLLLPAIETEGWITLARLTQELCARVRAHIPEA